MSVEVESKPSRKQAPRPGETIKLNKSNVDAMTEPGIYPDADLTGFRIRIGNSGAKSYQLVGKVKGEVSPCYYTIGKHGDPWTPDSARKEAERLRLQMRQGVNPNKQLKEKQAEEAEKSKAAIAQLKIREITFGVGFSEHIKNDQKETTVIGYKKVINAHLKDWLNKPLIDVTQADVIARFEKISSKSPSSAAHAMRLLRAVFRTVQISYSEDFPAFSNHNPVKILGHKKKGWNTLEPKQDYIADEDLPAFYKAVCALESQTAKDYLMVCVLTGMRMNEVCSLTWTKSPEVNHVDLNRKVITICSEGSKNKQRHMLAMSDYLYELFLRRWQSRESSLYVFPGKSKQGNFNDPENAIDKVVAAAGIPSFTSHSLRRTFATAADSIGYDLRSIQRLLNHKPGSVADRHYIQRHAEKTKEPMQRINEHLLKLMKAEFEAAESSNVIPLTKTVTG